MLGTFVNIFKVPDLRNKILFTVALLCIYRIGFYIPVPGFDAEKIQQVSGSAGYGFSAGSCCGLYADVYRRYASAVQFVWFGYYAVYFGIDYSNAAGGGLPALKKLRQEGQTGHKKIQEYTRYLTVPLCLVQSLMYMKMFAGGEDMFIPG